MFLLSQWNNGNNICQRDLSIFLTQKRDSFIVILCGCLQLFATNEYWKDLSHNYILCHEHTYFVSEALTHLHLDPRLTTINLNLYMLDHLYGASFHEDEWERKRHYQILKVWLATSFKIQDPRSPGQVIIIYVFVFYTSQNLYNSWRFTGLYHDQKTVQWKVILPETLIVPRVTDEGINVEGKITSLGQSIYRWCHIHKQIFHWRIWRAHYCVINTFWHFNAI